MAREFGRHERVADYLRTELAQLIQHELRDPRIGEMPVVTAVEVSRDLGVAKVYVSILGKTSKEDASEAVDALNNAAGFLRSHIAKSNTMRSTPKLRFYFDTSIHRGAELSALIDTALQSDATNHNDGEDGET